MALTKASLYRISAPDNVCPQHIPNADPVTGSAHCVLASYYAPRLAKHRLCAYQASARGGRLLLTLGGDGDDGARPSAGRVWLEGSAVTVLRGQMNV